MNNLIIPTTIVDGFFSDPDAVRDFALKQDYVLDPNHHYPGKRSKLLHELNPDLFHYIHNRFFSLFYPNASTPYSYVATTMFQMIDSKYKEGWIHCDSQMITLLIYLNKDPNREGGTTIYSQKDEGKITINDDKKQALFKGTIDENEGAKYRTENNNRFVEEIVVKNRYNRLLAFDSHLPHGANEYTNDETRLTLISFITKLDVKNYPIHSMHYTKA